MRNLPFTADFLKLQAEAVSHGETSDCAVKAVALATGASYSDVLATMTRLGRRPGHGTPFPIIHATLEQFGKRAVRIEQTVITARYPGKHSQKRTVTSLQPDRFPRAWRDGKTYLMHTNAHILAVVNGTVHDWTRGKSKDCITLFEVLPV